MKGKETDFQRCREMMVATQIVSRGITDKRVIAAMKKVPREEFIDSRDAGFAFHDGPLSIGYGQTISQPYIVAYMTDELLLRDTDRVLEIGTGSGYQTAVLAEIAAEIFTIEIVEPLAAGARAILDRLGYANIRYRTGDGGEGWIEEAPFDAIMITAAPEKTPSRLLAQLSDKGRMVAPVGGFLQYLHRWTRTGEGFRDEELIGVRFVPMTGGSGWEEI